MFTRFHGIDLHKRYMTISIRDFSGKEIFTQLKCSDFYGYIRTLTSDDVLVVEAVNNAFHWADEMEKQGATCLVVDPHKFKIIRDSWSKTDKKDAANLSLALWMAMMRQEFKMPIIYKPSVVIRDLRRLFAQYQMINKQIRQYKNTIQALLTEAGILLSSRDKERLLKPQSGIQVFKTLEMPHSTGLCVLMNIYLLFNLIDQKEILKREILKAGIDFESEMKLLITIKGVTPLLALAFLADIGDIHRFSNVRKFNAYLGVVPRVKASGGKTVMGHINKQSRSLSRSLYSQTINHFVSASEGMTEFYASMKTRRGAGRSRIAVLRRLFSIMRSMLLHNEEFRYKDEINVHNKMVDYEMEMRKIRLLATES